MTTTDEESQPDMTEFNAEVVANNRRAFVLSPQTTYKATEQYLDDEDNLQLGRLRDLVSESFEAVQPLGILELLSALEDLRNHLRGKYYGG